jgi:hypothetical protein
MSDITHVVGVVVDAAFGDRVREVLSRMPVWLADSDANRRAAERARAVMPNTNHIQPGGLTVFRVDPDGTPESWCADILATVAAHHDRYSHAPGCSSIEVFGAEPTPALRRAFASYRLTVVSPRERGFVASTPDGSPACSPNDDERPDS